MARFQFNGDPDLFAADVRRYLVAREIFRGEVQARGHGINSYTAGLELDDAGRELLAAIAVFGEVVE